MDDSISEYPGRNDTEAKRTVGRRLPSFNRSICKRFPCASTEDLAVHVDNLRIGRGVKGDCRAILANGSIMSPERTQDGRGGYGFSGLCSRSGRDIVDET